MWIDHDDPNLENRMQQAIGAIAQRRFADAETQLNDLVAAAPDWAETWNKRATLYYLTHRAVESVADIRRPLELEPSHFGAICGFGQICLPHRAMAAAAEAFAAAMALHPPPHSSRPAPAPPAQGPP